MPAPADVPELPEVEVVRRGLARWVIEREIADVQVHHARAVRRHEPGASDFVSLLSGRTCTAALRRGKYLWLAMDSGDALVAHLGMSGQLLVVAPGSPAEKHLRVRFTFADGGPDMHYVDQRTFGGLHVDLGGAQLPASIAHIARDPLDPQFDDEAFVGSLRRRRTEVKRALLDQTLISGVGNIYADEALWRVRLHGARPTERLTRAHGASLLDALRAVMGEALSAGGTSFDSLYVDVNGRGGYFGRSLSAYGRQGQACLRCGTPIRREAFMNRSSFSCPRCQPSPGRPRVGGLRR